MTTGNNDKAVEQQPKQEERPPPGDHHHQHAFADPAERAKKWNDPERDKWQHPEEIVAALALKAGRRGQTYPAALAAADEVAVDHFLAGHMAFGDIPRLLDDVLNAHDPLSDNEIDDVLAADTWARAQADDWVRARV